MRVVVPPCAWKQRESRAQHYRPVRKAKLSPSPIRLAGCQSRCDRIDLAIAPEAVSSSPNAETLRAAVEAAQPAVQSNSVRQKTSASNLRSCCFRQEACSNLPLLIPKTRCTLGRRMSASTSSTRDPFCESTMAVLMLVVVLPSWGRALVIRITFGGAPLEDSRIDVRNARYDSAMSEPASCGTRVLPRHGLHLYRSGCVRAMAKRFVPLAPGAGSRIPDCSLE